MLEQMTDQRIKEKWVGRASVGKGTSWMARLRNPRKGQMTTTVRHAGPGLGETRREQVRRQNK